MSTRPYSTPGLKSEHYLPLVDDYASHLERFRREMESSWSVLAADIETVGAAIRPHGASLLAAGQLASIRTLYADIGSKMLTGPVQSRLRNRPQLRALSAIGDLDNGLENMVRTLDVAVLASGKILGEIVGKHGGNRVRLWLMERQTQLRPLPLRAIAAAHIQEEKIRRSWLDGEFQLLLARTSLHLLTPWQTLRRRALQHLEDPSEEMGGNEKERTEWMRRSEKYASQSVRLLARYRNWCQEAPSHLAARIVSGRPIPRQDEIDRLALRYQDYLTYWYRQQSAIQNILELELKLAELAVDVVSIAEEALDSLEVEHRSLLEELDGAIAHLQGAGEPAASSDIPPPKTRMLAAETRMERLSREMVSRAQAILPASLEAIRPRWPLPGWREPWKKLDTVAVFQEGLKELERPAARGGVLEAEGAHRSILREIERAREVVSYSREVSVEEGEAIGREGLENALALLRYQREITLDVRDPAAQGLVRGIAATFDETHRALEMGRLGLLAHIAQETSERGARRVFALALEAARGGGARSKRLAEQLFTRFLYAAGLKAPPAQTREAVTRTVRLGESLPVGAAREDLPLIYRRLFRLDPVVDPRFLVGRDDELAGLREARRMWLDGKAVSVLLVGARGSGKTSMLNCASLTALHGLDIVRSQFSERLVTARQMEEFLCRLLDVPVGTDLQAELNSRKRVIILEEAERTFLRSLNGFGGLKRLLDLVTSSWHSTLWVISLNEAAAEYLDRAVSLHAYFLHRINAMSVEPEELRNAILLRHNLSGYRLSFPAPRRDGSRVARVRRQLGLETDATESFFDNIYEQSMGIFRAAFELWQLQIVRIEGGLVQMGRPASPDYSGLLRALSNADCFTLWAVLQHGSLTSEDLTRVFDEDAASACSRIERLIGLEILEPDPISPGYRVRPEAGRLVREVLHGQNL